MASRAGQGLWPARLRGLARGLWAPAGRLWALALISALTAGPFSAAVSAQRREPPRRVASLNLTADEILVEILPTERLVAVTASADDAGTTNIAGRVPNSVARFRRGDMERLMALRPDLVIVSEYTDADFLRLLEKSSLPYHRMEGLNSLEGFRRAILKLGDAVGEPPAARRLVASYDAQLRELARRLQGVENPRVLYWSNPFTAGEGTAIGAIIEGAGAVNVARELGLQGIAPLAAERAFLADPDVVLVAGFTGSTVALRDHPLLSKLRAVRENRIVEMPTPLLVALSHHAAVSCWYLAHALHPDRVPRERP